MGRGQLRRRGRVAELRHIRLAARGGELHQLSPAAARETLSTLWSGPESGRGGEHLKKDKDVNPGADAPSVSPQELDLLALPTERRS